MGDDSIHQVPAYILAGGKSSRFGSDKARALLTGQPLIRRIADAVSLCALSVTAIADVPDKYSDLGLRTIDDTTPGQGPLAGLEAAMLDCAMPSWLLLLSCDLIDVRQPWIESLLRMRTDGARCIAFRPGGLWQPMLALYHTSALAIVQRRLVDRRLRMQELLDQLEAIESPLPTDWPEVLQANTPDALTNATIK
jgi:molybdopterin-guanine dinucleotide biosynthesis protein A